MSETIVVPTDLSPTSSAGLKMAVALAEGHDVTIDLLHVVDMTTILPFPLPNAVDGDELRAAMTRQAEETLKTMTDEHPDVEIRRHIRIGLPWEEILAHVRSHRVDRIFMATHGRHGFARLLLGSTTERVLRGAPCPVWAVPVKPVSKKDPAPALVKAEPPSQILAAIDLSEQSIPVLQEAARLALRHDASLRLIHVVEIGEATLPMLSTEDPQPDFVERLHTGGEVAVRKLLEAHKADFVPEAWERIQQAPLEIALGDAPREIELAAERMDCDLLVLGRHGRRGFQRWVVGSVAERVIRRLPHSILVVPGPDAVQRD